MTDQNENDKIHHPSHYGGVDNPYEVIKIIEAHGLDFNHGSVIKYTLRAGKKDEARVDLGKAAWYVLRLLAAAEGRDKDFYNKVVAAARKAADAAAKVKARVVETGTSSEVVQVSAPPPQGLKGLFHHLWTKAVGQQGYVKQEWLDLERHVDQTLAFRADAVMGALGSKTVTRHVYATLFARIMERLGYARHGAGEDTFTLESKVAAAAQDYLARADTSLDQTPHQRRIENCMRAWGQEVPFSPRVPDAATRILRARLILEEALETVEALGVDAMLRPLPMDASPRQPVEFGRIEFVDNGKPDLKEIVDGCADVSVVTIGTLSACGIRDAAVLEEVDGNNWLKVSRGKRDEVTGKFVKPKDHPDPKIGEVIAAQIAAASRAVPDKVTAAV